MASRIGRTTAAALSLRASQMPSGNPMTTQNSTDVSTSDSVTIASDHAPMAPIATIERSDATARRGPDACQAIRAMTMMTTTAGVASSVPSTPFSVWSMGQRIIWNTGRKLETSQPSATSTHSANGTHSRANGSSQSKLVSSAGAAWLSQSVDDSPDSRVSAPPQGSCGVCANRISVMFSAMDHASRLRVSNSSAFETTPR